MIETNVTKFGGGTEPYNRTKLRAAIIKDAKGLRVDIDTLLDRIEMALPDGVSTDSIRRMVVVESNALVTPSQSDWTLLAARTLLQGINREVTGRILYYPHLRDTIAKCVAQSNTDAAMLELFEPYFDQLNAAINPAADQNFEYLGIQTLYDRYLLRSNDEHRRVLELPQHFFMRVAMGHGLYDLRLGINPDAAIAHVIDLYREYSELNALSSTPTLFNSGAIRAQMSSCFILAVPDDTDGILSSMKEAAKNSKFAGGIGMSFSRIRRMGARITSTGGRAGGPIRYKRVLQEMMKAFDQSGKRKGSASSWLNAWHPQFIDHLQLWNKSGDENERAHYIFPANWVPSLLIERWKEARNNAEAIAAGTYPNPMWSFFCPTVAPELMDLHGEDFKKRYEELEAEGVYTSQVSAFDLVSRMLNAWYQHGVFWTGFKDTINMRYPLRDAYTVDSSNLCTEVIGRADREASTVCNLASVNMSRYTFEVEYVAGRMQVKWNTQLEQTVRTMITALDKVIDCGWVPHERGALFNRLERMIGLGEMGLTECMAKHGIRFDSKEGVAFSNELKRQIAITAIWTSIDLAGQRTLPRL